MMTAAFTDRYVVFDVDTGYPGVLSPVTHLGSPPPRRKPSTSLRNSSSLATAYVHIIDLIEARVVEPRP
jgi:hypothetical protein